jgi:chromosome partitioning protein
LCYNIHVQLLLITVICSHDEKGVGKTTFAPALAVAAKQDSKSFALFDLDPQMSACFWADRGKS